MYDTKKGGGEGVRNERVGRLRERPIGIDVARSVARVQKLLALGV